MKTILFIHQSADLYGSDKTLLFLVEELSKEIHPIVIIPEEGDLTIELKNRRIEYIIHPVIKISRELYSLSGVLKLLSNIKNHTKSLKEKLGNRKIDIIHSNTLAVFLGAFFSKKYNIKHVWHIHEIIEHPKLIAYLYPVLVNYFSEYVVFNSIASFNNLCKNRPKLISKSRIIYNGLDRNTPITSKENQLKLRQNIFPNTSTSTIILGLFGRINNHKGQHLLLNAFEQLSKNYKNIRLLYIGSPIKSQNNLLIRLLDSIKKKELDKVVTVLPFQKDIWKYYDSVDIVIVPTITKEPFGLVALEGMLSYKPVIAANHGGLKEIILHNETGLLFKPKNQNDLQKSIKTMIQDDGLLKKFGAKGYERAISKFSLNKYINKFNSFYHSI